MVSNDWLEKINPSPPQKSVEECHTEDGNYKIQSDVRQTMTSSVMFTCDDTHRHVGGLASRLHLQQVTERSVRADQRRENQQGVYITDKQEAVTAASVIERLTADELAFSQSS